MKEDKSEGSDSCDWPCNLKCFATDCPCDVWCRGLTTCLLHVGPPFGNRFLNTSWAVGLTYWIYLNFFVFRHTQLYISWYIISFLALSLLLKYSLFFKYSCINIFHRCSLCTFYEIQIYLSSRVTLKFDGWRWKTVGKLFYAPRSYVCYFIAIHEFKFEL